MTNTRLTFGKNHEYTNIVEGCAFPGPQRALRSTPTTFWFITDEEVALGSSFVRSIPLAPDFRHYQIIVLTNKRTTKRTIFYTLQKSNIFLAKSLPDARGQGYVRLSDCSQNNLGIGGRLLRGSIPVHSADSQQVRRPVMGQQEQWRCSLPHASGVDVDKRLGWLQSINVFIYPVGTPKEGRPMRERLLINLLAKAKSRGISPRHASFRSTFTATMKAFAVLLVRLLIFP